MIRTLIRKTSGALGGTSMVLLFLVMLQVSADVIGRYFFNKPILGTLERSQVMIAAMVFLSWGYTQIAGQHIRLSLIFDRYPPWLKRP